MSDSETDSTDKDDSAYIPKTRLSRMGRLGVMASGVAGGMLAEGARQLAQGKRPSASDMLLTPANTRRITEQLAQLRGAAMKVGQLISMDAGDMLPPELTAILARLRSDARPMPLSELSEVLEGNWGAGWQERFKQFSFKPLAAASIGQVHSAHTKDGRHLALKIQYPGIRETIDSDVDNVATLLRISGLIPKHIDFKPLLEEAKHQLHKEADYLQEAAWINHYRKLLGEQNDFDLPEVYDDFGTSSILAMSYVEGVAVESLSNAPQEDRDRVATLLFSLLFREIFEFRLIQTDPNFANYLYDAKDGRLVLLDFGATRHYPERVTEAYRQLMSAAIDNDRPAIANAVETIGFFEDYIKPEQREAVIDLFQQACEPLSHSGKYNFGTSQLAARIKEAGMALSFEKDYWHTPPVDALFLHRKLGGLYLLAAKLRANVDVQALFRPHIG